MSMACQNYAVKQGKVFFANLDNLKGHIIFDSLGIYASASWTGNVSDIGFVA